MLITIIIFISCYFYYSRGFLKPIPHKKRLVTKPLSMSVAIVGTGPAGLAAAIMLARRGVVNISLFDQFGPPPKPDDKTVIILLSIVILVVSISILLLIIV